MRRRRMYVRGKRLQKGSTHRSSALQQRRTDGRRHTRETSETIGQLFPAANIFLWVGIGFLRETDYKKLKTQRNSSQTPYFLK